MNPSYLKLKLKISILFCLFLGESNALANDSIPKLNFLKQCKNADAYFLYSFTDVTYSKLWFKYKRHISVSNKLVINNSAGVDKFAYLNLPEYITNNLKEIKVRTLKKNGNVIKLDSSKVFQSKEDKKRFGDITYPIPGVEPGDTIETTYIYTDNLSINQMVDFISLYSEVPSLNSEYTIKTDPSHTIRYKGYNNFPEPVVVTNDSLVYCAFKMENIKGLTENENTCIPCELPYLYYAIEKTGEKDRTWKDVYNQEFNIITQPIKFDSENASFYNRWKKNVIGKAKDSSKYYKLNLLHKDILDNISMENPKENEILKSSGYFLKEKRLNSLSIKRLYRRLLEDLKIDYWAVFARSRQAGAIDPYYIRKGEFDHIFFAFNDESGVLKLLYPHDTYTKYQINEIPTSVYNTEAIIAKPYIPGKRNKRNKFINYDFQLAEMDSVTVKTIQLPKTNANQNFAKQVYSFDVDIENEKIPTKYRISLSGGVYTNLKGFLGLMAQDQEVNDFYEALEEYEGEVDAFEMDTITNTFLKETSPFSYTLSAEGKLIDGYNFLSGDVFSISLNKLIDHNIIENEEEEMNLNFYLDYSYSDDIVLIFNFPSNIEVLNADSYDTNITNEFGEYFLNLKVVDDKRLSIQSNYRITKDVIPKTMSSKLNNLNEIINIAKNKRILIKLKE